MEAKYIISEFAKIWKTWTYGNHVKKINLAINSKVQKILGVSTWHHTWDNCMHTAQIEANIICCLWPDNWPAVNWPSLLAFSNQKLFWYLFEHLKTSALRLPFYNTLHYTVVDSQTDYTFFPQKLYPSWTELWHGGEDTSPYERILCSLLNLFIYLFLHCNSFPDKNTVTNVKYCQAKCILSEAWPNYFVHEQS